MKKLLVLTAFLTTGICAIAQNKTATTPGSKIGYISTDELIGVMPEAEKADS
jgi:hypothetical protein